MDALDFGWRDGVLLLAALVAVYLVVAFLRLQRLRRPARQPVPTTFSTMVDFPLDDLPEGPAAAEAPPVRTTESPTDFAAELTRSSLDADLRQLREDLRRLGETVERQAGEIADLTTRLQSAQSVSPLYGEAMALARKGLDPAGIAGRCGISIGEAELVASLSRGVPLDEELKEEDEYGGSDHPADPGR
ncbi:MAG: DUF2802 domain-containing protein [Rhodocyclaceae bacterium]|nr:DUF2802 domain-containing protein [Rhodocyclaceae bacterium]